MRYGLCSATCLLVPILLLSQTSVSAFQSGGSYSVDEQCYCFGGLPASLSKRVVPTPVGGKSVEQVCERLGSGPGLILRNGVYNYPVYKDPQCGHGPFDDTVISTQLECPGTLDGTIESCLPPGPKWNLKAAFSKASIVEQSETSPAELAAAKPVNVQKASVSTQSIADFQGRVVTIDGQRYLQAKDGVKATGGDTGSRIILDGDVFLRDDESLDPDDLYRPQLKSVNSRKKVSSAVDPAPKAAPATQTKPASQTKPVRKKAQIESSALLLSAKVSRERGEKEPATSEVFSVQPEPPIDEVSRMYLRSKRNAYWLRKAAPVTNILPEPDAPAAALPSASLPLISLPDDSLGQVRVFSYVEAMPVSFDFGGKGVLLEGTAGQKSGFQFLGQLGIAETYTNVLVGGAYYLTPESARRTTFMLLAGIEHGEFELTDEVRAPGETFSSTDSGLHVSTGIRLAISSRLVITGGVGFSSYFEGDAQVLGGSYYSVTPRLDVLSRFKLGDNDLLGVGFRYYY